MNWRKMKTTLTKRLYASRLCGFSFVKMHDWINKWLWRRKDHGGSPDTPEKIAQKVEFADEGYYINLMRSLRQYNAPLCLPSKNKVRITRPGGTGTFDTTDWIWEPIRSRTD